MGSAATGPHVLRRINAEAVLAVLRDAGDGSARVADVVLATGLSRPAVTRAIAALAGAGVVEYAGPETAQVGRPAVRARFRGELGHVAGIDIGPHTLQVSIADLAGTVLATTQRTVDASATGPDLVLLLHSTLAETAAAAGVAVAGLWAVGVGTPGIVDHERGEVTLAPSIPGWAGIPLLAELRKRLGCPVLLDNDVNLAVLAERWRGEASDNLVYVHWGERIGSGIVIDGKPYRGATSAAGELGFVDLVSDPDAAPAPVRDRLGPFERLAGARAIHQLALESAAPDLAGRLRAGTGITPLFDAARDGDAAALAVVDTVAARFARGLAALLLILDPGRIVVGGGVSRAGDVLFDAVRRHLAQLVLMPADLRVSSLGDRAVVLGAVRLALDTADERLLTLVRG
ncbi:MAG TPA: ROK family protein [Kribbellaceae bacterium]